MAQNNGPKDEKLIEELYKKLNWFTFQASEEQFDADQVRTILQLLDTLDPLADEMTIQTAGDKEETVSASDVDAAFERFKNRYNITDEDLAKKDRRVDAVGKDSKILPFPTEFAEEISIDAEEAKEKVKKSSAQRRHFWTTASGKVALAFIIVFAAVAFFGIGTSAVKQKPFFEVVRDGVNSMKITVTGNAVESDVETGMFVFDENEVVYYESWEEIKIAYPDMRIVNFIPEGLILNSLYEEKRQNYVSITANYEDRNKEELEICIKVFEKDYAEGNEKVAEDWELILYDEKNNLKYYKLNDIYIAYWIAEQFQYEIKWSNIEELKQMISSMK